MYDLLEPTALEASSMLYFRITTVTRPIQYSYDGHKAAQIV